MRIRRHHIALACAMASLGLARPAAAQEPARTYAWIDRSEVFVPRVVPAIADQPNRRRLLVYGGWQENGVRGDTWEWDGYGWIRRQPLHDAGRRAAAASVFDATRSRVLLFGGASTFFPNPEITADRRTWEWDGRDWASLATANAPAPTMAPASTWDSTGQRMLTFGGFANLHSTTGDAGDVVASAAGTDELWAFDGIDWKQVPRTEPWPAPRGLCSMAWDPNRARLVLYSGQKQVVFANNRLTFGTADGGTSFAPALGDTWEWDGSSWTQVPTPALIQAGNASLFWDPIASEVRMILDEVAGTSVGPSLRRYTGSAWELVERSRDESSRRVVTSATWSTANQKPLVFAGVLLAASGLPNSDVSLLEELAGTPFESLPPAAQMIPVERAVAATEKSGSVLLFGGMSGASRVDSSFRWTGGRWQRLEPSASPSARDGASMARIDDQLVLHGGRADNGLRADTWTWNGSTWSQVAEGAETPAARTDASMFSIGDAAYVFGGSIAGGAVSETWRYRAGGWSSIATPAELVARSQGCATSDGTRGLLTGGGVADAWSFDGAAWTSLGATRFGVRTGCAMAFASETQQVLFLGGSGAEATQDLSEISPRLASLYDTTVDPRLDRPVRRRGAVFASNPITGGLLLTAGRRSDNAQQLADTWQLQLLGQTCTSDASCGNGAFCTEGVCCEQSECGPCGTCADPSRPGLCMPTPAGPAARCDGDYACSTEGRCRLGPGGPCSDNSACASGACIKSGDAGTGICCGIEGCALQCVEGNKLRNPDGTTSSCAPYNCEGQSCKTSCSSINDCTPGSICTSEKVCVASLDDPGAADSSCGCEVVGAPAGLGAGLGWLAIATLLAKRRRQCTPAASTTTE